MIILYIYSKYYKKNDFHRVSALFSATIHINDTLSDALFCINITLQSEYPDNNQLLIILILSLICADIPCLISLYQSYQVINNGTE